ncbi:Uncharacterized protein FWK35_00032799, partial [Aphis craccivora]
LIQFTSLLLNVFQFKINTQNNYSCENFQSSLMPVLTPPNYTYSTSNEQLTKEVLHPYINKTFMDLDNSNSLIYNQNPTSVSSLTGTSVEETQTISTIDSTPLAAPKISGLNQNELKAIRSELLAICMMGERLWNKFR